MKKLFRQALLMFLFAFTAIFLVATTASWFLLEYLLAPNEVPAMQTVLTNIATVGGIASGLALSGFAVMMTNTRGIQAPTRSYGRSAHIVFLGSYALMVGASLFCAILSGVADVHVMKTAAAVSSGLMFAGLMVTVLLINSMIGWEVQSNHLEDDSERLSS